MWFDITWNFEFIMSQVCVFVAVLSLALSCCTKNRLLILVFALLNSVFYGLQYLFLKEYSGAVLNFIGIVRAIWFFINDKLKVKKKYTLISLIVCLALLVAGEIYTFNKWYSILPLVATVLYTLAVWQTSIKLYRWAIVPIEIIGVTYNIMCHSIFGVIFESILLIVAIVSVIRFYTHGKSLPQNKGKEDIENISQNEVKNTENLIEETPN